MAIQMGGTVYDLEECELCYAPQFGSAKSPANFAGMVAANVLRGDLPLVHWDDRATTASSSTCATRRSSPSSSCRAWSTSRSTSSADAWTSCPRDREILVICRSGQRAYYATRILVQNGFTARTVAGGMLSHEIFATL